MHYQNQNGEWLESEAKIEITPTGASASKGAHTVNFAANINTVGAIDLTTPEGKKMRSHVLGLSYFDTATGKSALIAEIKDSLGILTPPNQIVYPDAFSGGIKADIRYTYTTSSFAQDVILRGQLPPPDDFGLNAESTRLEILTEFVEAPAPMKTERVLDDPLFPGQIDETLRFDTMSMGPGIAFAVGNGDSPTNNPVLGKNNPRHVTVGKTWTKMDARDFLIEFMNYKSMEPHLEALPKLEAKIENKTTRTARMEQGVDKRKLPIKREARATTDKFSVASVSKTQPGFLIDYELVTGATNFIFKGDTTYYVSGNVNLYGTTTLEGGTVIKFAPTNNAGISSMDGLFNCKTDSYHPAVFTARNDDSVGEVISGSTGVPANYLSCFAFKGGNSILSNVRFSYSSWPCSFWATSNGGEVSDAQFVKCAIPINSEYKTVRLRNVLMSKSAVPLRGNLDYKISAENVTIDGANQLSGPGAGFIYFTNSIVVAVTNLGPASINSVNSLVSLNSMPGIFQTVGSASYYLAGNTYRNIGTTTIDAGLLANLRKKTTYPPIVYSNATLTVTQLGPQAQRDTDAVDYGYHYAPLDYAFGGSTVNSMLTFAPGTAVGWFRTTSGYQHQGHGIHIADNQRVTFNGTADNPAYWARCSVVQEGGNGNWDGGVGPGGITGWAITAAAAPEVRFRFTRCSMLAAESCHFREDYGTANGSTSAMAYLTVNAANSEFRGGILGGYSIRASYTNCLFERLSLGFSEGRINNYLTNRNCTMRGGTVGISRTVGVHVSIRDCAFDATTFSVSDSFASNPTYTSYNYNAFLLGSPRTFPIGANDVIVPTTFGWFAGPLGNFYRSSTSPLKNTGSLANAGLAGLYHFTTQTDQAKELTTPVDIGYHYVAVAGNNDPLDTDGDGIPDYVEDANGNGIVDPGETSWMSAPTPPSWVGATTHTWLPQLGGGVWFQEKSVIDGIASAVSEYPRPALVGLRSDWAEQGYRFDLDPTGQGGASAFQFPPGGPANPASQEYVLQKLETNNAEFMWSMPTPDWNLPTPYNILPTGAKYGDRPAPGFNASTSYLVEFAPLSNRRYQYNDTNDTWGGGTNVDTSIRKCFVNGVRVAKGATFLTPVQVVLTGDNTLAGQLITARIKSHGAGFLWQIPVYYAAYLQYLIEQPTMIDLSSVPVTLDFFTAGSETIVQQNWANLRAKRGHVAPYSIQTVILGIEPYGDAQESMIADGAKYGDIAEDFRFAIRARGGALSTIPLGLHVAVYGAISDFATNRTWFKPMLEAVTESDFSYMDMYHHYRFGSPTNELNRIYPGAINAAGWQNSWIPQGNWESDFKPYLWMYEDVRTALTKYGENANRWKIGNAEHGLSISSQFTGNDMGAGLHWSLWISELMRYDAHWDMSWVMAEQGFAHAQLQYKDQRLTRTPGHYVYKMAQEFYGFEHHSNTYQSPSASTGTADGASYSSPDVVLRVFRNPADGHYHLFVINKHASASANITGWENWNVVKWDQLNAPNFTDKNPIGNPWVSETIIIRLGASTPGQPLTIPPISVNHIELRN